MLILLVVVAHSSVVKAAKSKPDVRIGTLVLLGIPDALVPDGSANYTVALYLDASNVAVVDQETSSSRFQVEGCTSDVCTDFYALITAMKQNCNPGADVCFDQRRVGFYTSLTKKNGLVYTAVGISLASGKTMWVVPIIEAPDLLGRELWRNYLPASGVGPRSPDEWQLAISNLVSQRQALADKAAYQAVVASNLAKIAIQQEEDCLTHLKVGDARSKVTACGTPDHVNSDLYSDQMVYPDGIMVYVNKASDGVENVQWTH